MRSLLALAALLWLTACTAHGPCCSDGDCLGSGICSADCAVNGGHQGHCLLPCEVDRDCGAGSVCGQVQYDCGCMAPAEGATAGHCGHTDAG
jgi:hypothetical protein